MNDVVESLTPKAKLALSRAELLAAMGYAQVDRSGESPVLQSLPPMTDRGGASLPGASVIRRWWNRHPVSAVFELLEPGLARYARRNPGRLVVYAAATGGLLVVARPWRLLPFGAVLALVLRTTDIAGALSAATRALSRASFGPDRIARRRFDTSGTEAGSTWSEARHTSDGS
ncbi:hypothetical protein [Variovorax saccharolyticus]|uniref:hypothetical protein n=1 Tax=Variovorax saccharolyticus TaxID=3053516 RepID=UPI0025784E89|nr:hypothetical protein [Variovorax sp. J31P216]MDM0029065.1 hypothetical protein [Variovorax sp. J31P216]